MKELSLQNCRLDGRYDVHALLGRGSYAEIYVARDTLASPNSPHASVVIKALNVFLQNDLDEDLERTLVENFQNEAIALDRVRHPNIISRLGHGTAKDLRGTVFHYLVLEYLPGGDLAKACPKIGFPLPRAFDYLEQVCAGLAHAHKCGVIHRDIKPQNLLLTADRQTVKIADFGVARLTQSDSPITRVGTNMYAPPEHSPTFADADAGENVSVRLTPAADIYSLAKSTYVLVTGESPRRFSNQQISELPVSIRHKPWASEFLRVLQKATRSNSHDRQQTVNDFWKELTQVRVIADAEEAETETHISTRPHTVPQASVARGYTPNAPVLPKFNTSRDLKFKDNELKENKLEEFNPRLVVKLNSDNGIQTNGQGQFSKSQEVKINNVVEPVKKPRRRFLRRAAVFLLSLAVFAGALFAMQNYIRNGHLLPEFRNPFKQTFGSASGDVNLRKDAGAESQQIGMIPKGSRVRILDSKIVNSKDNWYEVVVVEFARQKDNPTDADRGWVSGRYIDVQE